MICQNTRLLHHLKIFLHELFVRSEVKTEDFQCVFAFPSTIHEKNSKLKMLDKISEHLKKYLDQTFSGFAAHT